MRMLVMLSLLGGCSANPQHGDGARLEDVGSVDALLDDAASVDGAPVEAGAVDDSREPAHTPNGVREFVFVNKCAQTVWVGALQNEPRFELPESGGFELDANTTKTIAVSLPWGGRFWGRTGCSFDEAGRGSCATGDCGGRAKCDGLSGATPATLAEFTLEGYGGKDYYDVSLVDGYNLKLAIEPIGKSGVGYDCGAPACVSDLNTSCPSELQKKDATGAVIGCLSACERFNTDAYCCRNAHGTPETCPPSSYSESFKAACPTAYSYAYDDTTSTYTCTAEDYRITFCP